MAESDSTDVSSNDESARGELDPGYAAALANLDGDETNGASLIGLLGMLGFPGFSLGRWGAEHGYATGMPDMGGYAPGADPALQMRDLFDRLGLGNAPAQSTAAAPTGPTSSDALASARSHAGGGFPSYGDPSSLIYGSGGNKLNSVMAGYARGRGPVTQYGRSVIGGGSGGGSMQGGSGVSQLLAALGLGGSNDNMLSANDTSNLFATRTGNVSNILSRLRNNGSIGSDLGAIDDSVNPMLAKGWDMTRDIGSAAKRLGYNPDDYIPQNVVDATDLASTIGGKQGSTNQNVRYSNSIARARSGVR